MLKKLANGEYSLRITFWLFGVLGFFLFNIITNMTHNSVLRIICDKGVLCAKSVLFYTLSHPISIFLGGGHLMSNLGLHILISTVFVVYTYILLRGLWKSSASYEGHLFWPICAKLILVFWAVIGLKSII